MNRLALTAAQLLSSVALASGADVDRALSEFNAAKDESTMTLLVIGLAVLAGGVRLFFWFRKRR